MNGRKVEFFTFILILCMSSLASPEVKPSIVISIQVQNADGSRVTLGSIDTNQTTPIYKDIYTPYYVLKEQNNHLFVIPHDDRSAIYEYNLNSNTLVGNITYPPNILGTNSENIWQPIILSNGTIRFIGDTLDPSNLNYFIADKNSNVIGFYNMSTPSSSKYPIQGGFGSSNMPDTIGIFPFSTGTGLPNSTEVLVYNYEYQNSTSFFVDRDVLIDHLWIWNDTLYGFSTWNGSYLVKSNNGIWTNMLPFSESESTFHFHDYFFFDNSLFTIEEKAGYPFKELRISEFNPSSLELISEFNYNVSLQSEDQYLNNYADYSLHSLTYPLYTLWLNNMFNPIRVINHKVVFDDFYQQYVYGGSNWTVYNITKNDGELLFMNLPYTENTRIDLVTEFYLSTPSSSTAKSPFLMVCLPWMILVIIRKYRTYKYF